MRRNAIMAATLLAAAMVATGCASSSTSRSAGRAGGANGTGSAGSQPGRWDCPDGVCDWTSGGAPDSSVDPEIPGRGGDATSGAAPVTSAAAPPTTAGPARSPGPATTGKTAGAYLPASPSSVDDNAAWADYLAYRAMLGPSVAAVDEVAADGRQLVTVTGADGRGVFGPEVTFTDAAHAEVGRAFTDPLGRAVIFTDPPVVATHASIVVVGGSAEADLPGDHAPVTVRLSLTVPPSTPKLDVLLILDATNSMADEVAQLQARAESFVAGLETLPGGPDVHVGLTVFRDRGEPFVTRTFSLTDDHAAFVGALREVRAAGGGDTPEDLAAALHDAAAKPGWRGPDTLKLAFLITDAPPHEATAGAPSYLDADAELAARGVIVLPVAATGTDARAELAFRQLALRTLGRTSYLAQGADGRTAAVLPHAVVPDDRTGLAVDALLVSLARDELGPLGR